MIITIRRPVIKRCPFRDEIDAGRLELTLTGEAPELHGLDAAIEDLCTVPVSHEDFTASLADLLPPGSVVRSFWNTGSLDVEVEVISVAVDR